jgi:hypothetical protein
MVARKTNRRVWLYLSWVLVLFSAGGLLAQEANPQPPTPSTPTAPAPTASQDGAKAAAPPSSWVFNKLPNSSSSGPAANPGSGQAPAAEPEGAPPTLHVVAGRSLFLNSAGRLRRVYVSNPAVLDSLTASPYESV